MEPMSDEERERPSRSLIRSTWQMHEEVLEAAVSLALLAGDGKLEREQILSICKSSFYAGAHFLLVASMKISDGLEKGELSEEAAADIMVGLTREMNDYLLSKEAEIITKITLARAEAQSKGAKNDSHNPSPTQSPASQAGTPRSEGNADGSVGNG